MKLSEDIIRRVAERTGFDEKDVRIVLRIYLKQLRRLLRYGIPFHIKKFAIFYIKQSRLDGYKKVREEVREALPYCHKDMTEDEIKHAHPTIVLAPFQVKYIKDKLNGFTKN